MFVVQIDPAGNVQQRVAGPEELAHLSRPKSPRSIRPLRQPIPPPATHSDALHTSRYVLDRIPAIIGKRVLDGIEWPRGAVLDVPHVVSEPLKSAHPVEMHPGLAPKRALPHHPH